MRLAALFALLTIALGDISPVDHVRDKFYTLERDLWVNVTDPEWRNAGLGGDIELTKAFAAFNDRFEAVRMPPRPPLESWLWVKASEKLTVIDGLYKNFMEFVKRQAAPGAVPAPVREWLDLAEVVLMDPKLSVAQAVRKLDDLLEHGDLFRASLQEGHPDLCELQMSPHQLIYDMYNTISLTEIKGYAMMQFSWMLLKIYGKGNFTEEASLTRQRYAERSSRTAAAARSAMAMARRGLYRCDPVQHKEGETYAQVTRLLQGYIENEVDMNADGTCRDNCAYYTLATRHGCFKEQFCAKQTVCNGRIIDCQYIDSDMWVCPAGRNSIRRYEWIEYENGRTLGKVGSCTRGTTKVDSWWRWLFWHCSYCMCLCDEAAAESDRYFSLMDATSDVKNNKVVTGVRLIKSGRVFHLQISEGLLGERGSVTPGEWVPVAKFDPSDPGVREGLDYHTLTYEQRAIDLDELDSPLGHILTGVRFSMIGAHLHFEIRSTPFNYTTGRLSPDRSQWISNDNTEGAELPRSRLDLYKPDIPTRSLTPLPVDSKHDQYVEFVNSDFEADAAQSTVPFVDIQPVIPMKGAALASGAGLIHRGARGSGGYIAVKLFTYDFSRHVRADPPPNPDENTTEFLPLMIN
ncbi:chemokine-like protein orion isoform X3 [Choristoneura fumiferana]|uniref:chemokine-like protein orion isoform X3 n=1 Tax=Choristoneura fumiferana TaxID=7141 RepID=UPI003D15C8AB